MILIGLVSGRPRSSSGSVRLASHCGPSVERHGVSQMGQFQTPALQQRRRGSNSGKSRQAIGASGKIGVESGFKSKTKSELKHDPAVGLMQVRPSICHLKPAENR
jgi:hypothetical protein